MSQATESLFAENHEHFFNSIGQNPNASRMLACRLPPAADKPPPELYSAMCHEQTSVKFRSGECFEHGRRGRPEREFCCAFSRAIGGRSSGLPASLEITYHLQFRFDLTNPVINSRPIDPVFRADSVVLAISAEKDGNLRVVYARIGRYQGRPAWRGAQAAVARPYPAVTCHVGVNGGPLCLRDTSGRPPLHVTRSATAKMRTRRGLGATETGGHRQAMLARSLMRPTPPTNSRPIDPVFRADSVVLAISAEKDGNLRVVYARIGRYQGRPAWRGAQAAVARPYPAVTCHVGVNGGPLCLRDTSGRPPLHVTRSATAKMRTRRGLGATETGGHRQAMLARSAL